MDTPRTRPPFTAAHFSTAEGGGTDGSTTPPVVWRAISGKVTALKMMLLGCAAAAFVSFSLSLRSDSAFLVLEGVSALLTALPPK